ncbi:MAG TPA: hypothetical protein VFU44_12130 [Candidatus Limnocylindria bacterium]|nr:hypothetical protein [Candidatus Limnocylindria bacterium]
MTHERLEHRLRTDPMPDEPRYLARPLPATVAEARAVLERRRSASPPAWLGLAAVATVAVIVVALVVIPASLPTRNPSGEGSDPTPVVDTASPTSAPTPPADTTCASGNLVFRPEAWGGAAGSRGTSLTILLVDGAAPCDLSTTVSARILDGSGTVLVSGVSEPGGVVRLELGAQYAVGIAWSNWCDPEPQPALRWDVRFGDGEWIDVIEEASGERPGTDPSVPVPPCMGEGGSNLSVTGLQPAG